MTAVTAPARGGTRGRTLNVVRLQLINSQSLVWVPLLILAGTLVICLFIFAMIPGDGVKPTGAANAPLWYFAALGVQAMTLSFPFSQAMSITRREFFIGTVAFGAIGSAMMASLFLVLALIERATEGYGMNGMFAYLPWLFEPGWASAWLSYFTLTMFLFVAGFWIATAYKRFGTLVLSVVMTALALAIVIAVFFITRTGSWPSIIEFFAGLGPLAFTLYGLGLTALMSVGAYLTLRKAIVS